MNKEKKLIMQVFDYNMKPIPNAKIFLTRDAKEDSNGLEKAIFYDRYGCPHHNQIICDSDGKTQELFEEISEQPSRIIKFACCSQDDIFTEIEEKRSKILYGVSGYWFLRIVRYENEVLGIVEIETSQTELPLVPTIPDGYKLISSEVRGGEI